LPDGIGIFKPKIPILVNFGGGLPVEDVGRFYGHLFYLFCDRLVYLVAIWYNLWSSGIFFRFGILLKEKSGNPAA
jgi:hypothetical protein